jgi:hypothetical protein
MRRVVAVILACAAIATVAPAAHAARIPADDSSTTTVVPVPSSYTAPDAPLSVAPVVVPEVRPLNERITYTRAVPPQLPRRSGAGRRIVYSNRLQWVWVIDKNDTIIRQMPVSGRKGVPEVGSYAVTTKSPWSFSLDFDNVTFTWMTRFAFGPDGGNVGFLIEPLGEDDWHARFIAAYTRILVWAYTPSDVTANTARPTPTRGRVRSRQTPCA